MHRFSLLRVYRILPVEAGAVQLGGAGLSSSVLLRIPSQSQLHLLPLTLLAAIFPFHNTHKAVLAMDSHLVSRGQDRNYTGFLTKTIVYSGSFVVFLGGAFVPFPPPPQ